MALSYGGRRGKRGGVSPAGVADGLHARQAYIWEQTRVGNSKNKRLPRRYEQVGIEQHDGATWLHIRMQVSEAKVDAASLPQYWLALDEKGEALFLPAAPSFPPQPGSREWPTGAWHG